MDERDRFDFDPKSASRLLLSLGDAAYRGDQTAWNQRIVRAAAQITGLNAELADRAESSMGTQFYDKGASLALRRYAELAKETK